MILRQMCPTWRGREEEINCETRISGKLEMYCMTIDFMAMLTGPWTAMTKRVTKILSPSAQLG